ncbi:MAG: glutamine--fructose-6-phosphate transaminase (isomerizing), partial [Parvibaculum sp.]
MCGIVGVVGEDGAAPIILEALRRLEYRGYDSAGIATLVDGEIVRRRAEGKLTNLDQLLRDQPMSGFIGIGHTRWATHGAPTERNAHPHVSDHVAVVHNGIIENFRELKENLIADGAVFDTETDTEVIAHLVSQQMKTGLGAVEAARASLHLLEGAFALGIMFKGQDNLILAARRGSPLAIGHGDGAMYLGSDAFALAPMTNRVTYLDDGDWAVIRAETVTIYDAHDNVVQRELRISDASSQLVDKGNHRHFMAKEIHEQPEVIGHTLADYIDPMTESTRLPELPFDLGSVPRITMIACGTAFYATQVAKYWFEQIARVPVEIDIASEFRYREAAMPEGGLAVFVSQSGETADTLAALNYCKEQKQHILSIVNVQESTIARASDVILPTFAGPEIGVASTKAFTCQLTVLAALAIGTARARGAINEERERKLVRALLETPRHVSSALTLAPMIEVISHGIAKARDVLYLGRGTLFPIAMEGALKLKEISYIHAEGYAAGELKHGPIALIDEEVPIIVIAPSDHLFDKTVSNMHEVIARGGKVVLISDAAGLQRAGGSLVGEIEVPTCDPFVHPIVSSV